MPPVVIMLTGGTGAGKTTVARHLADDLGGVRFSIDDWMTALFWMDSPVPIQFDWTIERITRCETLIWSMVLQAADRGIPSILDLGFTTRAHRRDFAQRAATAKIACRLHWVDVPADDRWRRVEQRNADKGDGFAMPVDRAMFDFMEARWEAPDADEMVALNGQRSDGSLR